MPPFPNLESVTLGAPWRPRVRQPSRAARPRRGLVGRARALQLGFGRLRPSTRPGRVPFDVRARMYEQGCTSKLGYGPEIAAQSKKMRDSPQYGVRRPVTGVPTSMAETGSAFLEPPHNPRVFLICEGSTFFLPDLVHLSESSPTILAGHLSKSISSPDRLITGHRSSLVLLWVPD